MTVKVKTSVNADHKFFSTICWNAGWSVTQQRAY